VHQEAYAKASLIDPKKMELGVVESAVCAWKVDSAEVRLETMKVALIPEVPVDVRPPGCLRQHFSLTRVEGSHA